MIKITFPDSYYVEKSYDELNRLESITLNGAMTPAVEFEYDYLSRRKKITFENGTYTDFTYFANDLVETITHTFDGSSVQFTYGYNAAGELTSQEVDDADFMWHPAGSGTVSYGTASDINQYPTVGGDTYSYNLNGCLEDDDTWTFVYDTENRMTSADDGGTPVEFLYDPQNRQVQKAIGASKTRFVYSGIQRIADYDGSDALVNRFVYGTGLDDVLLQIAPNGDVTYLHADRLGSVVATSDGMGDNTTKFAYGPFGETDSLSGISHGYTGQRFDSETGLYYMKSRYYQPVTGRFHQPDPIGTGGGLHLYNYTYNTPFQWTDPLGTEPGLIRGSSASSMAGSYSGSSASSYGGAMYGFNNSWTMAASHGGAMYGETSKVHFGGVLGRYSPDQVIAQEPQRTKEAPKLLVQNYNWGEQQQPSPQNPAEKSVQTTRNFQHQYQNYDSKKSGPIPTEPPASVVAVRIEVAALAAAGAAGTAWKYTKGVPLVDRVVIAGSAGLVTFGLVLFFGDRFIFPTVNP